MHSIIFFGVNTNLGNGKDCGEHGMVCEEDVIEIDFPCLSVVNEVTVGIVDTVEQEASEVHGDKIEVHAFDAESEAMYFLTLKLV